MISAVSEAVMRTIVLLSTSYSITYRPDALLRVWWKGSLQLQGLFLLWEWEYVWQIPGNMSQRLSPELSNPCGQLTARFAAYGVQLSVAINQKGCRTGTAPEYPELNLDRWGDRPSPHYWGKMRGNVHLGYQITTLRLEARHAMLVGTAEAGNPRAGELRVRRTRAMTRDIMMWTALSHKIVVDCLNYG